MRPAGHVGGDLAGFFEISARRIAVFSIDVSGHGVASAMMTARLAGMLSGALPDQNIALTGGVDGNRGAWPPEMVAWRFNRLMLDDMQVDQYFTMAYAELDLLTGKAMLVQAGHPHPVLMRKDGGVELVGKGGMPIGLIPGVTFERIELQLHPGDRLFLVSDGVTECTDAQGQELGAEGLNDFLRTNTDLEPVALLDALVWHLSARTDRPDFPDDVSGVLLHYRG
jgi:sigma-B regulation protein RsbU (phosphoserine phosphatase)